MSRPQKLALSAGTHFGPRPEPESVSVIVPMRNEIDYIKPCLDSLLMQTYEKTLYEIIVVDGRSSDGSSELLRTIQLKHPNLLLIDNPSGITPVGMNLGIRKARNQIIIVAGAHATYASDFLHKCVEVLRATGADVVGGPVTTIPGTDSLGARLTAAILSSPFGVGNSRFRTSKKEGYVDAVPFGAFRAEVFEKVGLFNEKLVRNQDNDLAARIRSVGGKIFLSPAILAHYVPAKSFGELLRQIYKKAQWHVFTLRQNVSALGLRHLAPALFVTLLLSLSAVALRESWARIGLVTVLLAYLFVGCAYSLANRAQYGSDVALLMPFACLLFHVAYGIGTLVGIRYLVGAAPTTPIGSGSPIQ